MATAKEVCGTDFNSLKHFMSFLESGYNGYDADAEVKEIYLHTKIDGGFVSKKEAVDYYRNY